VLRIVCEKEWKKEKDEGLRNLYCPPNIVRVVQMKEDEKDVQIIMSGENNKCIKNFSLNS